MFFIKKMVTPENKGFKRKNGVSDLTLPNLWEDEFMKKRFTVVLTAVAMVFSLTLTSCSGKSNEDIDEGSTTVTPTVTEATGNVNEYGWEVPEKTIEFSAYAGVTDPATFEEQLSISNNAMADFLKEKFNVVINKEVYLDDSTVKRHALIGTYDRLISPV